MSRTLLSSILEELANEDIVKISERDVKDNFNDFFSCSKMNTILKSFSNYWITTHVLRV
jgi:hypothetical protein